MPKIISPENIPAPLKEINQWCVWKGDKIPRHPNGAPLKSTEPQSWLDFETARMEYSLGSWEGIGFCLTGSGVVGIDLDDCFTGDGLKTWAVKLLSLLPETYTEISPSGNGLHIYLLGHKRGAECKRTVTSKGGEKLGEIEIYDTARYFTVTGDVYQGREILNGQDAIDLLTQKLWPEAEGVAEQREPSPAAPAAPAAGEGFQCDDLISLISQSAQGRKFKRLLGSYKSAVSDYGGDHSRAVHALSAIVAWYTPDFGVLDAIMRRSALYSSKWAPDPKAKTRRGREGKWKALGRAAFHKLRAGYEAKGDYYKEVHSQVGAGEEFEQQGAITAPSDETLAGDRRKLSGQELYEIHVQLAEERGQIRRDLFTTDLYYFDCTTEKWEPCFSRSFIGALRGEARRRGAPYRANYCEDFLCKLEKDSKPRFLLDIPIWDGEDRIRYMCSKLTFESVDREVFEDLFKDWCTKMWLKTERPAEVQNRCILLSGKQGIGKDVWIKSLFCCLGKYLADFVTPGKFTAEQDMSVTMGSAAVMLISEFDKTEQLGPGVLKDLITKTEFTSVRKYDRGSSSTPNRCSIIAACNPEHVLKDATGNRRFLIFRLTGPPGQAIRWTYPVIDREYSAQILAQCRALADSRYAASEASEHVMQKIQEEHTPEDPHTAAVFDFESMILERAKLDLMSPNCGLYRIEALEAEFNTLSKNYGLTRRQVLSILKAAGCSRRTSACRLYGTRQAIRAESEDSAADSLPSWEDGVN